MILESIEISNFMCYAGYNKFEFTEGINVIIGDNGYGKSKLFDAFYWVMYNECFDTNKKKFQKSPLLKKMIVSDKAINEIDEGLITASVILTFKNLDKGNVYILERKYSVKKLDGNLIEDIDSEEVVWQKDLHYLTAKEVNDSEQISRIKKTILPDNIKPYMWFQGEQVESIIDFNKTDTLTQAINVLSNITRYDHITEISENLKESTTKEFNKKQRDLSSDKDKSTSLELQRNHILDRLKELQKQELQIQDTKATAEEKSEQLLNKISDAQKIKEVEAKRRSIEKNLQETQEEFTEEQKLLHKKMFTNKWVLKGTENLFEKYSSLYNNYEQTKLKQELTKQARIESENQIITELQARLPVDVPEPIHLENMLSNERCLVCDREAPIGSDAYLKIKELLDRSKTKVKTIESEDSNIHDFGADLRKLYQNGLGLSHNIKNIDDDIASTFRRLRKLDKKRKTLTEELKSIESEINSLIVDTALNVNQANDLLNQYSAQNELAKRAITQENSTSNDILKRKQELQQLDIELGKLVSGEIPAYLIDKLKVVEEFNTLAHSTRRRVFDSLVKILETEANQHYQLMTQGNMSARGIIKLKELNSGKNYMPELTDDKGNVLMQLNTGNIILIKLATIMAIISARQGSRDTDLYTLITDAPMSVFGEDYTIGFCKTVSNVYRQSIIMSKEFYKNMELRKQLLTNPEIKLGKVYLITPSIPENSRANRNQLSTNIQALN
jgi:DNA sulfur modification protein DndD